MYRLTLYYLIFLILVTVASCFLKLLPFNPTDIVIDALIASSVCWSVNEVIAKIVGANTNIESSLITALILVFVIPPKFPVNVLFLIAACGVAMASKYIFVVEKRHWFNPAAFAITAIALFSPEHAATWWIGTPVLAPFVFMGGVLLIRKIRREQMVWMFFAAYIVLVLISTLLHPFSFTSFLVTLKVGVAESAMLFLGFVMLTEPLTSPTQQRYQRAYAFVVAALMATAQFKPLGIVLTPELALCLGNLFSNIISPNYRLVLKLKQKVKLCADTYGFVFDSKPDFHFLPGQFMEWTLPHPKPDNRGIRRYFSIASSPTQSNLVVIVKIYTPSSSYKKALLSLNPGDTIIATQLEGDFILPSDCTKPMVFIAGGVGIAPFISMIQYMVDKKIHCNIRVLYVNRTQEEIGFTSLFERAKEFGVRVEYVLTNAMTLPQNWTGLTGHIDIKMITSVIPDYKNRRFYISGPQLMVTSVRDQLVDIIPSEHILVDFFPGYAEST